MQAHFPLNPLVRHRRAKSLAMMLCIVGLTSTVTWAQPDAGVSLSLGEPYHATLEEAAVHNYTVSAGEGYFISGAVDQLSVDVVVTIYNLVGEQIAEFDGPGRGPEVFQFETGDAGLYRIEVAPFENATGEYEIALRRLEPLATTPEARVDQLMCAYDDAHTPGGVVAVVVGGEMTFARAYGAANLTYGIPFEVSTRTNIGSTSKQFTAYAIMLLAEQGALALDDDVRMHITELPDLGETVTVRHLLTHTSGYREFLNLLAMTGRRIDRGDSIDRKELIRIVQRQSALQNSPGAEWNYNNTAYGLLAMIVQRVGGAPFPEWMATNVFQPLAMNDTFVRSNPSAIIENSAQGYLPDEGGGYRNAEDLGGAMGAGGIYTTVGDLAKWVRNFHTSELGSPQIFEQMTTPYELTSGKSTGYGFGLFIDEHRGLRRIHHGGADTAHRSMLMYFPDLDAAVITQSNNAAFSSTLADSVADAFFGNEMEAQDDTSAVEASAPTDFDPKTFDPKTFDRFVGRFEMEEMPGFILTFSRDGDQLFVQATGQPKLQLQPISLTSFKLLAVEASVTFHQDEDDEFDSLTMSQNGDHHARRLMEEPWSLTSEDLRAYAGQYFSEELETTYRIAIVDDSIVLQVPRFDDIKLTPTSEHHFTGSYPVASIVFEADDAGAIVSLVASNGRARGLRFERGQ